MKIIPFILGFISYLLLQLTTPIAAQNSTDSLFNSLTKVYKNAEYNRLSEIIRFNQDTILVAGWIGEKEDSIPVYEQKKNIIYKTENGGADWKKIKFKGNAWVYDSYHNKNGQIWVGGSDEFIHYSSDFGETWQRKPKPFEIENRINALFMVDSLFGIAGGLENCLAITYDNWQTTQQIPSPIDQKKNRILQQSSRNRFEKVVIIDSIILVNQKNNIFYSNIKSIDWTAFRIPVWGFEVSKNKREIDLESRNGKHFVIGSDLNLIRTYEEEPFPFWESIAKDTVKLDTKKFLEYPIKSITLNSTTYKSNGYQGTSYRDKEYIQSAKITLKGDGFYFKSKEQKKRTVSIHQDSFRDIFFNEKLNMELDELFKALNFEEADFLDYQNVLELKRKDRKDREKWGGNCSFQISLTNPLFDAPKTTILKINQAHLSSIFGYGYLPITFIGQHKNNIVLIIKNKVGEEIEIHNKDAVLFSLPWTIHYNGSTMKSFNPNLTQWVKSLLPKDFDNYELLLGGDLISLLIEQQVIENISW